MKRLILTLLISLLCFEMFAQRTITGTVTDEAHEGLPGVAVEVKGTEIYDVTMVGGIYTIDVPEGATTLIFSYIGMETKEVTITGDIVDVVLLPEKSEDGDLEIDDVVVVAYGKATKRSLTGSAVQIDHDEIENKNTAELTRGLAGVVAGVEVLAGNGRPGSNALVRIRGYGSMNADRSPLFVVDGIPYNGNLSAISALDIASYTVLKDASAAALYGSRGSNGVILITTEKGKEGHSSIEFISKGGINAHFLPMYKTIDNPEEYTELIWEGLSNDRKILSGIYIDASGNPVPADKIANTLLFDPTYGLNPEYNMWIGNPEELIDPLTGKFKPGVKRLYTPESYYDNMFGSYPVYDTGLKFSGGNETSDYYTSFNYRDDKGYLKNSRFKRLGLRSNLNFQVVPKHVKTGVSLAYTYLEYQYPGQHPDAFNNAFNFVTGMPPIYPVFQRDADGNKIPDELLGGYLYDFGRARPFSGGINAAGVIDLDKFDDKSHQIEANPYVELSFFDDFKFTTRFGGQYQTKHSNELTNLIYGDSEGSGENAKRKHEILNYTFNNILSWSHNFSKHYLSAFIGHEISRYQLHNVRAGLRGFVYPGNTEYSNAIIKDRLKSTTGRYSLQSYIGQLKYDYDGRYFLQANVRRDGTSRFPFGKWGTFGSVGVAWEVANEDFLSSVSWLKELKLKFSYGVLGNQDLLDEKGRPMFYPAYDLYEADNMYGAIALLPKQKGNPDLTWESSKTINLGIRFNIANIFETEIEYFQKNTENLLFHREVPSSFGYSKLPVNSGKLQNKGVEFNLRAHIIDTDDLKISLHVTGTHLRNTITEMPSNIADQEESLQQQGLFAYQKGHSIYDFYMREYAGVNPDNGNAQWYAFYDEVGGSKIHINNLELYKNSKEVEARGGVQNLIKEKTEDYSLATLHYLDKSVIPTLNGGFGLNVDYKGFGFYAHCTYGIGGYAYDAMYANLMHNNARGSYNWSEDIRKRWQNPGDETDVPRLTPHSGDNLQANAESSRFLTKKTYLSINNLSLSYTLSESVLEQMKISDFTIFISGENLFLFTKRKGFNPTIFESGNGSNIQTLNTYLPISTLSLGVKFKL
ncbi:MAG: SusC/RagA family TonB-linked outer membrane protein [Bacteroidia bacterium]|nr:MAG: SusC/RagA family TonB-linked outer membrane protein [Bacteroidia bacterium]